MYLFIWRVALHTHSEAISPYQPFSSHIVGGLGVHYVDPRSLKCRDVFERSFHNLSAEPNRDDTGVDGQEGCETVDDV